MSLETLNDYEEYLKSKGIEPLQEVTTTPHKSDRLTAESKTITDTNRPEQRIIRLTNQLEMEPSLERLYSMSLIERVTYIREKIFGQSDVRGDLPTRIRNTTVRTESEGEEVFYPDQVRIAERYFPDLVKFADNLYDEMLKQPSLDEDQVLRFCASIYDMGILVHPYIDGNGQTFRIVAESYLQEFMTAAEDKYFPFKISAHPSNSIRAVHTEIMDKGSVVPSTPLYQNLIRVQEFIKTMPTYDEGLENKEEFDNWLRGVRDFLKGNEVSPDNCDELLRQRLSREILDLVASGADEDIVQRFHSNLKSEFRQGVFHGYLDYMLSDPNALEMHKKYILTGKLSQGDTSDSETLTYEQMAFYTHNRTVTQMKALLQNSEEHKKNFKYAIEVLESKLI